ncbi:hypothetical protein MRB53_031708 [Persea americana]|uniref:Uncharacterized protein n=1 Tax=Persea americana TaxID=3435 RepID=A0ACC2KPQ9_PERAE|nr:hypothetical protein MRB53_031708 [Persea americana]
MSGDEIDGESLSLSVSADRSVFDVEIPQKTRVSDDSAAEMRFDNGDMDGGVLGSGGLSAVESEGTRVLEGEMGLDSGDGDFEGGKSEMECGEVEVGGSTVKAEGLGFNGGNGSFGGGNGGIGDLVVRSEEGSGSVSSGCGYGEIKRKTEIDDRGDDNLFDEMECKVVRSEEVRVSLEPGSEIKSEMEARISDINADGLHFSGGNGGFDGGNDGMEEISAEGDMEVVKERRDHDLNSSHHDVSTDAISGTWVLDGGGSLSYGFEYGDMVWGKVKSHPWWPGHIFNEAFASSSVRRMRRGGHVLVAFFGDSSYGWFDPAELIHFEPNYAEKSRQTNSRNFMKAVEEATDEASRRTALGLACRCRNPFNFRPASVPGYFVVDVFDFEPGGVYSGKQVEKARDSFQPDEALSFVEGAALMPFEGDHKSIDWIKNMAMLLAYRKAVFEEFDETYAQAFGMEPVRPSRDAFGVLEQPDRAPPRAPLSGPLVIAEALGERKNSGKPLKVKGLLKKDKYLFKRRDELNEKSAAKQEYYHASQPQANVVPSLAFKEASGNFPSGDYVLQKRAPVSLGKHAISTKQAQREVVSQEYGTPVIKLDSVASQEFVVSPTVVPVDFPISQPSAYGLGLSMQGGTEEGKLPVESLAKQMDASPEMTGRTKLDETIRTTSIIIDLGKSESLSTMDGVGKTLRREVEGIFVEDNCERDQVMGNSNVGRLSMSADDSLSGKAPGTPSGDVVVGKITKSLKRPIEADLGQQKYIMGEKKKKKKKKDAGLETGLDHQRKHPKIMKDGEVSRKLAGKSIGIGLDGREHPLIDPERKDGIRSDSATLFSKVDTINAELKIPKLVNDLLALALDPFHAIERNSPAIVRQVFLKFRSLVYQKSLVLPPASESETSEPGAAKSVVGSALQELSTGNAEAPLTVEGKEALASKSLKRPSRLDDPSKAGRKRGPSDRQEEMSAKRLKKLNDLKQLALEKKAGGQKTLDGQKKVGQKETVAVAPTQPTKMDPAKKQELPARVTKPTALVMKFPPKTTLPSAPELKARFARYGPLDLSGMRVYWRSSTCRIVFKYKSDAQAAYNHAIRNNSLFGQVKVRYILRELELSASELPETEKRRVDNGADDASPPRPSSSDFVGEPRLQRQTSVQLKSCLKKPSGDEAPPAAVLAKDSPRVKFLLGGDDSKGEQMMASSSNNGSSADGAPSSSMAFDVNINNIKSTMVIPSLPLPLPFPSRNPDMLLPPPPHSLPFLQPSRLPDVLLTPPPPLPLRPPFSHAMDLHESRGHFSKAPQHAHQALYNEGEGKKESAVDISHQLLTLLMRCSDIVTDVKSTLGYVPYHPL